MCQKKDKESAERPLHSSQIKYRNNIIHADNNSGIESQENKYSFA